MLAVMMYNGYMFISVVLGAFIGYFLFGHISMKTNMENLQAIQTKIVCSSRCADSGESPSLSPFVVNISSVQSLAQLTFITFYLSHSLLRSFFYLSLSFLTGASCSTNLGPCSNDICNNHF
jgi:hypothetical protein